MNMNMNVTRAVISDIWPLYASGETSAETRALVEAFLTADPEFAGTLRESSRLALGVTSAPVLPPDVELKALAKTRRRLWGYPRLLQLALIFTMFAFGRVVSDTSWDVSPRNFIVTAAIAVGFWIAFLVSLIRLRARILLVTPDRR
jgi:anti-sigma factor RsiW